MPYLTYKRKEEQEKKVDWMDLILNTEITEKGRIDPTGTITRFVEKVNPRILAKTNFHRIEMSFYDFTKKHENLFAAKREDLYHTFYIPKHSGGLRRIDEPNSELMSALRELKDLLAENGLYHTSAFAYIKGRSIINALQKHQRNESNWYLKTDFSNFFGSINLGFTMRMLKMIYPYSELSVVGFDYLTKALELGFLNDGLPQGTCLSPFLTNLIMIPIDFRIFNDLTERRYVYTRYADDFIISCKQSFKFTEMVKYIDGVLEEFGAPFRIKPSKTRYGSRNGQNWNLGLMINNKNEITVGHQKKKQFKAMMNNFILDYKNDKQWDVEDVQAFAGLLSYYRMVEEDYFKYLIAHYNEKYKVNFEAMIKRALYN